MADIISIADFFINRPENFTMVVAAAAVLVSFIVAITEYKSNLLAYITNRRNKWWFVYFLLSGVALLILWRRATFSRYALILSAILWGMYTISFFRSLKPKSFNSFSDPILRHYENLLIRGYAIENIQYFEKPGHWYLCTAEEKLEYALLSCMYFAEVHRLEDAYKRLNSINEAWLYHEEKEKVTDQKNLLLVMMGNMQAAYYQWGDPEKNDSKDSMVWFGYSYIFENRGDIDKALEYCEKSRAIVDAEAKASNAEKAQIYNNYGRVAVIKGNRQEALRYYDLAWEIIKQEKDMRLVHTVASNRITQMALSGKSREECYRALNEYKDFASECSIMNQIEVENTSIFLCRQFVEEKEELKLIEESFKKLFPKLPEKQQLTYTASTFAMLMNRKYDHKWFDGYVKAGSKNYEGLPIIEKLSVFRTFMSFYDQANFRVVFNKRPYLGLRKKIQKYYRENALKEIEEEINNTSSNDVFMYMNLKLNELYVRKHIEGSKHIENSKQKYIELYQELYDKGLHLDAVKVLMNLLDECTSSNNVLVKHPYLPVYTYFSALIDTAQYLPDPQLTPDGIHVDYPYLIHKGDAIEIRPVHADVIIENIDKVVDEFKSWRSHPFKIELCANIIHLLMCLGRSEDAEELLRFFEGSGVNDAQMASWARDILQDMRRAKGEAHG